MESILQDCLSTINEIGKDVKITYKTVEEVETLTVDEAVDYFCIRVQRKVGGELDSIKQEICEFLSSKAVDGKLENHTTDTIAWISWRV